VIWGKVLIWLIGCSQTKEVTMGSHAFLVDSEGDLNSRLVRFIPSCIQRKRLSQPGCEIQMNNSISDERPTHYRTGPHQTFFRALMLPFRRTTAGVA
jgi:hypothetical protein